MPAVEVGRPFPEIELQTPEGPLRLPSKGTPVVVEFYRGAWCPVCRQHLGALDRRDLGGVRLYVVSTESCDLQQAFKKEKGLGLSFASDPGGRVAERLGVVKADGSRWHEKFDAKLHRIDYGFTQPATFVIDREGVLRFKHVKAGPMRVLGARRLAKVLRGLTSK